MTVVDAAGAKFDAGLFISLFKQVKDLAPARFLTLRIHPNRYQELYKLADIPESIQIGPTPGPLGKVIMRVNCIRPPMGVYDGIAIIQDAKTSVFQLVFEIHGNPEMVVNNLGPVQ